MRILRGDDSGPFVKARDYVSYLRTLFRFRCAYCLTPDNRLGGEEAMKVDHFLPESRRPDLRLSWANLYYCCDTCNNRKSNLPTDDEANQGMSFVDPCEVDPSDHFRLEREPESGDFCHVTHLSVQAEYTIRSLHFNRRRFLRDFWRELHAEERSCIEARQNYLNLLELVDSPEPEHIDVLEQWESKLATIRERWPLPRG